MSPARQAIFLNLSKLMMKWQPLIGLTAPSTDIQMAATDWLDGSFNRHPNILGMLAKLQKATANFVFSVRLQLGSHWTDFHEI